MHRIVAIVDGRAQQLGKQLGLEDPQAVAGKHFAHRARLTHLAVVAVAAVDEHRTLRHILHVDVAIVVADIYSLADVATAALDRRGPAGVGEHSQRKAVAMAAAWHRVAVDGHVVACCIENFANSLVELVVND